MALKACIPKYAFGTSFSLGERPGKMAPEEFKAMLRKAIELGCTHFDCAPLYKTQKEVGQVLKEFIGERQNEREGRPFERDDFFITSKLPVNMMSGDNVERSLRSTLEELQLDHLDLFLVHAPFSTRHVRDEEIYPLNEQGRLLVDDRPNVLLKCWLQMVGLRELGLSRFVGLSNVNERQLDRLHDMAPVDVVQNEFHLFHQDRDMIIQCEELDVHYEGYAALGCPPKARQMKKGCGLDDEVVARIAREHEITPAQVVVKWLYEQPLSFCIKADNRAQLEENFTAVQKGGRLTNEDMLDLDELNRDQRLYYYDTPRGILEHPEYPFSDRRKPNPQNNQIKH